MDREANGRVLNPTIKTLLAFSTIGHNKKRLYFDISIVEVELVKYNT